MGHLQIKIGPLTRTLTIPDTPATAVALEVVERTGGPVEGTNAEKLDHILEYVRDHLVEVAQGWRRRKAELAAEAAAEAAQNELNLKETPNGSPQAATRSATPEGDTESSTGKRSRKRNAKTE